MKTSGLCLLLCTEAALGGAIKGFKTEKRQFAGALAALAAGDTAILGGLGNGQYGRKPAPGGAPPVKQQLKSDLKVLGAKRIKVRTGPYLVPGMNRQNPMSKHWGMLETYYDTKVEKPCSGDCNILRQVGGLEYVNGTNANINSGLWLHHMVHFNTAKDNYRWDAAAYQESSCLPHEGVNALASGSVIPKGRSAKNTERYFVTGNERTPFNFYKETEGGKGSAYHLRAADQFYWLVELMNMNMKDTSVYITMTYDYTEGALPQGWSDVKTVFLDANACKSSEVPSPKGQQSFQIASKPWRPNIEGRIIDSIGHLHDGGTRIDIQASGSKDLCKSKAVYSSDAGADAAMKEAYTFKEHDKMVMHGDKVAEHHIVDMDGCGPKDVKVQRMSKDQSWKTTGFYDYKQRTANVEAGGPSEVMAIAIVLVAVPQGVRPS